MQKIEQSLWGIFFSRALSILTHLRFTPYDNKTEQGRAGERIRLLGWAVLTSGLSKCGSLLIVLASVRWGVDYLGAERFGLWMTITSLITLLSFADFGMSNSLVNLISNAAGRHDLEAIRRIVSNGLAIMIFVSSALGFIFYSVYFFIDWSMVVNVSESTSILESGPAIAVYVTIFLISLPLSVVQRVQVGLQESWRSNLWTFVGQLLALIGLGIVVQLGGGVPYLVLAVAGIPVTITAINHLDFFLRHRPEIKPRLVYLDKEIVKKIAHVSLLFLIMQFMAVIGNATDNIVIAQILGAAAVAPFSIIQKLTMILGVAQLFIVPMWPAFGESMARGDYAWAKKALTKILIFSTMLGIFAGFIILLYGEKMIRLWAGASMVPNKSLILGFAVFSILMSVGGSLSVFLNNGEFLRRQAAIFIFASVMSVIFKFVLVSYWQDASGAIWGTVIGYSIFFVIPAFRIAFSRKNI